MIEFKKYLSEFHLVHCVSPDGKTQFVSMNEDKGRALRDKHVPGGRLVTKEIGKFHVTSFLKDDVNLHPYLALTEDEDSFEVIYESTVIGYIKGKAGQEDRPAASAELALDMAHLIAGHAEQEAAATEKRKVKSVRPNREHVGLAVKGLHDFRNHNILPVYDNGKLSHFKHAETGQTYTPQEAAAEFKKGNK